MENNDPILADYFGHDTEAEFIDWAAVRLKEHRGVDVVDKSAVRFRMELLESDGCCEICYTEDVRVVVEYEGTAITFEGYYSYVEEDSLELSLGSWWVVKAKGRDSR